MIYSYEKFLTELGHKLRQLRIDRGLTLRAMIIQHGFHLAQWQGFEKGKGISVPSLLRLCEVFDLSLEDLIAGVGITDSGQDTSAAVATEAACEPPKVPERNVPPSVASANLDPFPASPDRHSRRRKP